MSTFHKMANKIAGLVNKPEETKEKECTGNKKTKKGDKKKDKNKEQSGRIKKKKYKVVSEDLNVQQSTTTFKTSNNNHNAVNAAVVQWIERALNTGVAQLRDEYRGLAKYTMQGMTQVAFDANTPFNRNRYQDVPCQDQRRVALKSPPAACDYVHANYVGTSQSDKKFICTQGPLDNTIDEFWWLVWQEGVENIVMLCNIIETGKIKCSQYWPAAAGEKKQVAGGALVLENIESKPLEQENSINLTTLKFTYGTETRTIRHLQWLDWPDRGVPPCKLTSMELLSAVRGTKVPIVVHCSAGIGRTGTIVAIEYILQKLFSSGDMCMPMSDLMKELRAQRAYSIQNDLQYLYIHRIILCYMLEKYKDKYAFLCTDDVLAKYKKFVEDYDAAVNPQPAQPAPPPQQPPSAPSTKEPPPQQPAT